MADRAFDAASVLITAVTLLPQEHPDYGRFLPKRHAAVPKGHVKNITVLRPSGAPIAYSAGATARGRCGRDGGRERQHALEAVGQEIGGGAGPDQHGDDQDDADRLERSGR